jgi:hypothetical protein
MLKLSVSIKLSKKKYVKITLVDSLNILNSSLEVLSKAFKVETSKGIFPYSFVSLERLNYIGSIPEYKYYNKLSLTEEEFDIRYKDSGLTSKILSPIEYREYSKSITSSNN